MKRMKKTDRLVLVALNVMMMTLIVLPMLAGISAATREENVQKIQGFLSNDAVEENMQKEHGISSEKILNSLNALSDSQVENLANHANRQVGGALDTNSGDDFWTFYKWYLIAALGLSLLVILMV